MKKLVLVDTCSFIDYFRDSKESLIPYLASQDAILLSKVVRLELLKGARKQDRRILMNFFDGIKTIANFPDPDLTEKHLLQLHGRGFNLGLADLLILSDAVANRASILTSDRELIKAAKFIKIPTL